MDDRPIDLDALAGLTDPDQVHALEEPLQSLGKDTHILLFIAPGCPVCPHQLRSVATVKLANPHIGLEIVDATQDPERAARYQVRSVPTTVVNDDLIMMGLIPAAELARRLVERQGPEAEKMVFGSLVETGRHTDAAERLATGRGAEAFLELWARSTMEERMGLLLVAEEALLYDPDGLDPLVPPLIAGLDGTGPLADDATRRGDTADLLARIGHPDARPALERLVRDPNPQVAEAAEAALETLGTDRA